MKIIKSKFIVSFTILFLMFSTSLFSQKVIPFQGNLLENGEAYTGTAVFVFSISSISWTETISNVNVNNGYYAVNLGETTPLPDSLFSNSDQVSLNISIDGQALSAATLYAPLFDPTIDDTDVEIYSENGNLNISLTDRGEFGAEGNGSVYVHNTNGNRAGYLQGRDLGGRIATLQPNDDGTANTAAWLMGHQGTGLGFMNGIGSNKIGDGTSLLVDLFMTNRDRFGTVFSDGYIRSGIDFYDNEGTELAFIGGQKNQAGGGKAGQMILFGQSTANVFFNAELESGNGNLPYLKMYGQNSDGGQWFMTNIDFLTKDLNGNTGADLALSNTSTGSATRTIFVSSSDGTSNGGKIDIADNSGTVTISMDGGNGSITATSVTQTSDKRLKKNIEPLEGSLDNIQKLRGVSYDWKSDKGGKQIGFIAQELEKVYPELVATDKDGMKSVNYAQMTAVLLEAVKELSNENQNLKNSNQTLEAKVTSLSNTSAKVDALAKEVAKLQSILSVEVANN